jgi:hypothetical protein
VGAEVVHHHDVAGAQGLILTAVYIFIHLKHKDLMGAFFLMLRK